VGDAKLRQGTSDLSGLGFVDLAASLRREEVVRTAVGVERSKQALFGDRLEEPLKTRHGPLLFHQNGRVDGAGRIVQGDDEVEIVIEPGDPAMGRAVLEQQHAGERPWAFSPRACPVGLALLAMGAAPLRLGDHAARLQRQPCHGVAEVVMVPLLQLLVEMLHREVAVALLVEDLHARQLRRRRPPRRRPAEPAIAQPLLALLLVAHHQPAEIAPRHPQHFPGLVRRQPPFSIALQRLFESNYEYLP
jgi:hypothetical protein